MSKYPPNEGMPGRDFDDRVMEGVQCARCGSTMTFDDDAGDEGLWRCLSDYEWCQANPREGRENVEARWSPEYFTIRADGSVHFGERA